MSVTREDMLRELELLPVWRARVSSNLLVETPPGSAEDALIVAATSVSAVEAKETLVSGEVEAEVIHAHVPEPLTQSIHKQVVNETQSVLTETIEPLVQTSWLLYCPKIEETSQLLLQNIVNALRLPQEAVTLQQQPLQHSQVQARFCVLFGLAEANQFLGTDYLELDAVRGQVLTHGDMAVIVTHHPQALLAKPLLKRETWQDLCLLLAKQGEQPA